MLAYACRDDGGKSLIIGVFDGNQWIERDPIIMNRSGYRITTTKNTNRLMLIDTGGCVSTICEDGIKDVGITWHNRELVELGDGFHSMSYHYYEMCLMNVHNRREWTARLPSPIVGYNFSRSPDDGKVYVYGNYVAQSIPDDPNVHVMLRSYEGDITPIASIVCNDGHSVLVYDSIGDRVIRYDSRIYHAPIFKGDRCNKWGSAIFINEYILVTINGESLRMIDLRNMAEYRLPKVKCDSYGRIFGIYP